MVWTQADFDRMRLDWKDRNLVGWKARYADGSTVTSREARFEDIPQRGLQVLTKFYRREKGGYSKEHQNGLDMYILYSIDALELDLPPQVKLGKNLPYSEFRRILDSARADQEIIIEMKER